MFCNICGAQLQINSKFCTNCGNKLEETTNYNYMHRKQQAGQGEAIASIVLGLIAFTLPIPILDLIIGIAGLVLAYLAKKKGREGIATAGLVISIIGTMAAMIFTFYFLIGQPLV